MRWEDGKNGNYVNIWRKVAVAYFKVLSQRASRETEENHANCQ
jgi:hypothetical protein